MTTSHIKIIRVLRHVPSYLRRLILKGSAEPRASAANHVSQAGVQHQHSQAILGYTFYHLQTQKSLAMPTSSSVGNYAIRCLHGFVDLYTNSLPVDVTAATGMRRNVAADNVEHKDGRRITSISCLKCRQHRTMLLYSESIGHLLDAWTTSADR